MRLLLDTHVVLWWLADSASLSPEVKDLIDRTAEVYISAASIWEVTIKQEIGKIAGPPDLAEAMAGSFWEMPIKFDHAMVAGRLPMIHRDPFDRMLVAQARCEELTLVTRDADIPRYEVTTLPA